MQYLSEFLVVATIHLLGVISPGPDFVLITRNSLIYSKKTGIYSAIGLGLGILVHVTYSLVGIGFIIAKSLLLFTILKYVGASYLFYIGLLSLKSPQSHLNIINNKKNNDIHKYAAIKMGFLTNVTNPKATLFFFSLFTQVISPKTPTVIQILYGIEMSIVTFAWFAFLATLLNYHSIKNRFSKIQNIAEKIMGFILISLAIKLALLTSR